MELFSIRIQRTFQLVSTVKGPAGYGLKAFQIAKQIHSAAAQEI